MTGLTFTADEGKFNSTHTHTHTYFVYYFSLKIDIRNRRNILHYPLYIRGYVEFAVMFVGITNY